MAKSKKRTPPPSGLPVAPIERWLSPVKRFMDIEAASGFVLLGCTVLALVLANSPLAKQFIGLWKTTISFTLGDFSLQGDIGHLVINDALMTLFFFVVGLEVKWEIVGGELRDPRKAMLPIFGALGGVLAPAAIYLALQWGQPGQRGWAIPMATDIAFVVGFLTMFGKRVPFGLKIFLLSLAIVDDLIAVLIIAFVFSKEIGWSWLGLAGAGFVFTYFLNRVGVRTLGIYFVIGAFIWIAFFKAGIHPTVAGVLLGLLTPASAWIGQKTFVQAFNEMLSGIKKEEGESGELPVDVSHLKFIAREAVSPLRRLEESLHPWVAFVIVPLFALANAGVPLEPEAVTDPVAKAVAAGLVIGKPVGILFFCWLAVTIGLTSLPSGVNWKMLAGGACLAGIGFTMALFLNALAFPVAENPEFAAKEAAGKIGTLAGSVISAVLGAGLLYFGLERQAADEAAAAEA